MQDVLLVLAGISGMGIAVIHGFLGHRRILAGMAASSAGLLRVNAAVFQLSTLYWFAGGGLLVVAPYLFPDQARSTIAIIVAMVYLAGGLGNIWATRARHFGGPLLLIVSAIALIGA